MNAEQPTPGGVQGSAATRATAAPPDKRARPKRRPALLYRFPKIFLRRPVDEDWAGEWQVVRQEGTPLS